MTEQDSVPHECGRCTWFGFHVQYECRRCAATLTYLYETGEFLGAHKGLAQNVACIGVFGDGTP